MEKIITREEVLVLRRKCKRIGIEIGELIHKFEDETGLQVKDDIHLLRIKYPWSGYKITAELQIYFP